MCQKPLFFFFQLGIYDPPIKEDVESMTPLPEGLGIYPPYQRGLESMTPPPPHTHTHLQAEPADDK